jgi:3-deoxy-D-manno-octulosonic-acid transferase
MLLLDLLYLLALTVLSPWLLWRAVATGRYRRHLGAKLLGRVPASTPVPAAPAAPAPASTPVPAAPAAPASASAARRQPVAWFHAVSLGEVAVLGTLVPAFRRRHPDYHVVVSSTTDSGLAEAHRRFPDLRVIAFPFDFSWAVAAALDTVRPAVVVLVESELWPNFLAAARRRATPVLVVNARVSPRTFRRLRPVAALARRLILEPVTRFAVQESEYADRLRRLGVPEEKLVVTGSVKYDGATGERDAHATRALASLLAAERVAATGGCVWLAGSTHAPEEAIVLDVFTRLRRRFPELRLLLVPRHPDRFAEVARLVEASGWPFVRRSSVRQPLAEMPPVVLLDTVGELGAAWGLADVGFTGGSLDGYRGGQSMIEPAGYGVPCLFGPHVWNFRDVARRLVEVGGAVVVPDAATLEVELARLIADAGLRARRGAAARELVRRQQGATARTLDVITAVLRTPARRHAA